MYWKCPAMAVLTALACSIPLLGSEPVPFLQQNFDDAKTFSPGPLKENWGGGSQVSGGWKHYSNNAGLEIVTVPVSSAPYALKITRKTGGNVTFFRENAIPQGHDFTISFRLYLPRHGQLALWFTDGGDQPFGGLWIQEGQVLSGYVGQKSQYTWKPSDRIAAPAEKFFTVEIQFNAGAQTYVVIFRDDSGAEIGKSRNYPYLTAAAFKAIMFIDSMPVDSSAVIDDLRIVYSPQLSEGKSRQAMGPAATKVSEQATPNLSVTRGALRLGPITEKKAPHNDYLRYCVIMPFQVGPRMAAAFVNRNIYASGYNYDSEDGTDVFLFDDFGKLIPERAIPLNRSGVEPDAEYSGKLRYFNRFPVNGGFVPYGARLNRQPHPHAGTGFGISQAIIFPVSPDGTFNWDAGNISRKTDFFQFAYDGKTFKVVSKKELSGSIPIPGSEWSILNLGMAVAIPDGADLLLAAWGDRDGGKSHATGISRWSRSSGSWQPVEFTPIAWSNEEEEHNYYEPSLVRDRDGALIFAARDDGRQNVEHPAWGNALEQDINVWRSGDNGKTWTQIVHVEQVRTGPMALGRAADGTLFVMGNPIIKGKTTSTEPRTLLYLWPLNDQRHGLMKPVVACDAFKQFGKNGTTWYIDHPNSTILRLDDGREHAVIAYRVRDPHLDPRVSGKSIAVPSPQAGSYLEEVSHPGKSCPIWEFQE